MALTRGRVISARDADVAPSSDSPTAQTPVVVVGRVLPRALADAYDEARAVIQQARADAEAIVTAARDASRSARETAEREGREEGVASLTAAWMRFRAAEADALRARENDVVTIARVLAERLLGRALELDPSLVLGLAREALSTLARARKLALYAHPADASVLRAQIGTLGFDASSVEIIADASRPRGCLRAESDLGTLDADLAPQLDRLVAALRAP